ncbi:uncharacterized protein [Miscanthus floridulus]|uniref:uncharacterized protein n=1 Tax=Miscanthus floridulus TaxID=154761 RepID=UPI00345B0B85
MGPGRPTLTKPYANRLRAAAPAPAPPARAAQRPAPRCPSGHAAAVPARAAPAPRPALPRRPRTARAACNAAVAMRAATAPRPALPQCPAPTLHARAAPTSASSPAPTLPAADLRRAASGPASRHHERRRAPHPALPAAAPPLPTPPRPTERPVQKEEEGGEEGGRRGRWKEEGGCFPVPFPAPSSPCSRLVDAFAAKVKELSERNRSALATPIVFLGIAGDSTKMASGRHRPVRSLYQAGEEAEGSDARRRRNPRSRRPPVRLQVSKEAEPVTPMERAHEEEQEEEVS